MVAASWAKRLERWVGAAVLLAIALGFQPALVEWHLSRARRAIRAGDDDRAYRHLQAAMWQAPGRPDAVFLFARLHRRMGDAARVPALLRQAEKLGGDGEHVDRERVLLLAQTGRLSEAEPRLADLLVDDRGDGAEICAAYVRGYFANLRVSEATALLDAWQAAYPDDAQAPFMRGYLMQALALRPEAAAAYRAGLDLEPGNTRMRFRLAEVLADEGRADEAAELFDQCLRDAPDDPEIACGWAEHLFRQGDLERPRTAMERWVERQPGRFESRRLLGEIELAAGRFAEAAAHLEAAARQRPYDTTARNALGKALRALGRDGEAEPHFAYVAAAEPSIQRMERQLSEVVRRPDDPELRYQIGAALLKYGSPHDGARWLRTVLELNSAHRGAHEALAAYYQSQGQPEAAAVHRRQAPGK